jgi:tetratricopeptide (TPR) repeat protein
MRYLDQGDFPTVEKMLSISTSYQELKKTFPQTYQTNGNQSPIIIGDFGTVTYIVDELVTYDLPEGLTINLLQDLKLSKDSIRQKTQEVREWFEKYRSVERELARSPGVVNKRAYVLFKKNDFDGALKELDKAGGSDQATASSHLLKAKILLLQINYKTFDSTMSVIKNYFEASISLSPRYESLVDYGKFLTDYYYPNPALAIPILTQALDSANTLERKVIVSNYLSNACMGTDNLRAMQIINQALDLLSSNEPLHDSILIVNKAILEFYLGRGYSFQFNDGQNFKRAVNVTLDGRKTLNQLPVLSSDLQAKQALMDKSLGLYYFMLHDTTNAFLYYGKCLQFFEAPQNSGLINLAAHVRANLGVAEVYTNTFQYQKANDVLLKTKMLIESSVNLKSQVYVQEMEAIYTMLIRNLLVMNQGDDALNYSIEFKNMMLPFAQNNSSTWLLPLAEVNVDLGGYYLKREDPEKSRDATESAYHFFISNLSTAIADKMKFEICIQNYHAYYDFTKQYAAGLAFNNDLLKIIKDNKGTNPLAFMDLEARVYFQICELYYDKKNLDSAESNVSLAVNITEYKAKGDPYHNMLNFTTYSGALAKVLISRNKTMTVDSLANAFIITEQYMSNVNSDMHDHYQGDLGFSLAVFAVAIGDQMDSLKMNDTILVRKYLTIQDRIFEEATKYFELAAHAPNENSNWYYANFLYQWAKEQNRWITYGPSPEQDAHRHKKSDMLIRSSMTANALPPNGLLMEFKKQITALSN